MGRGKSRSSGTRDAVQSLTVTLRSPLSTTRPSLTTFEDLRTFDFEPDSRPARLFSGAIAPIGVEVPTKKKQARSRVPYQLAFTAPAETLVCVRRARRRQVLFAKHKTGKRGQRKPHRSKWSEYKCR